MPKKPKSRPSTFAERLAYARWARQLTSKSPEESDKDLAARIGVTPPWMAKWKVRDDAPPGHREMTALAQALGVSWEWLAGNADTPPLPALWRDWYAARLGKPVAQSDPRYITGEMDMIDPALDRKLTEDETEVAREITREVEAARGTPQRKRGGGGKA